ncbi:MAG: nitroreductase family protein [Candidatus Poseidoniia archaeon]|nr:nitroreductase family protein [Candidatus Poseidoniia archaeon]MDP6658389.1 nitroreductase family protein [Candidatus Poseidoniia archaeon]MDP6846058.1 nitroreductase family protein [Candidatus Poseidoniia archaeon]MDP7006822.1 nitroreductase family protein [Candidatus Poseidoniia archaeon]
MTTPEMQPLDFRELPLEEMQTRVSDFVADLRRRRTVRHFTDRAVPRTLIEECLRAANSAPSGANRQPWHFVAVGDAGTKSCIRTAAEAEEREFYHGRAPDEWLDALEVLGTDEHKPFLEVAPWLIVIFAETYGVADDGEKIKNYYVPESVGIATGFLIAALHRAGLATLTHTPSPMGFLRDILGRGEHERAFLILVTGYPAGDAQVPALAKKRLADVASFVE